MNAPTNDTYETGLRLWRDWTEMWNGKPELALTLVAPRFALHLTSAATTRPGDIRTPEAVEAWVRAHRAKFRALVFDTRCGPFVDVTAGIVAGPWFAEARIDDAPRWVCGMDTIAFRGGRITEYWTLSTPVDEVGDWATRTMLESSTCR